MLPIHLSLSLCCEHVMKTNHGNVHCESCCVFAMVYNNELHKHFQIILALTSLRFHAHKLPLHLCAHFETVICVCAVDARRMWWCSRGVALLSVVTLSKLGGSLMTSANMAAQDELSKFLSLLFVLTVSPNVILVAVKLDLHNRLA